MDLEAHEAEGVESPGWLVMTHLSKVGAGSQKGQLAADMLIAGELLDPLGSHGDQSHEEQNQNSFSHHHHDRLISQEGSRSSKNAPGL